MRFSICCRSLLTVAVTVAAASPTHSIAVDLLQPGSKIEKVAEGCQFTEGPAVDRDGNLYFSDGPNDRILRRTPDGKVGVFHSPCGRANGLAIDAEGRLVMCQSSGEGGKRRVARREKDGTETVLAETYDGKPFIAPNDLTIDKKGRIYFTDPYYGPPAEKSQPTSGVYRIDAPSKVVRVIEDIERPNGILLTPDNKLLYVSDRGIDGLALDEEGNIHGAAGEGKTTGLFVISPDGKLLLHHPMPEFSTNTEFGGADGRDLFLTAGGSVYRLRTVLRGAPTPGGPKWGND